MEAIRALQDSFRNSWEKLNSRSVEQERLFTDAVLRAQENRTFMETLCVIDTRHDARGHILRRNKCWSRHHWEASSRRSARKHSRRYLAQPNIGRNIGSSLIFR